MSRSFRPAHLALASVALLLAACAEFGSRSPAGPAVGAALQACTELAARFNWPRTVLSAAENVPAGKLMLAGAPVPEHCLINGRMNERVSAVDGQTYAIGFQMRLPQAWNGRFFHQGNGGLDGFVTDALGPATGGGPLTSALQQGFAVLSSDAGHNRTQLPFFGLDPQARADYGYQAVGSLTPMARSLIRAAYGKEPDRSYIGGCSNGGRHAMVAAARYAEQYDGVLAGNPGFNLPRSALAQLWGAQQYNKLATSADLASALTPAERKVLADAVLDRCDSLDGLADGLIQDTRRCQNAFDLARDVRTCVAARDGTCLSAEQKAALSGVFNGARAEGEKFHASFPFDAGLVGADWASWKFVSSITNRDPVAVAYVFQTPPAAKALAADARALAMNYDVAAGVRNLNATAAPFNESALAFMTPPASDLSALKKRGGKMMVYHGMSDGVFSPDDTVAWWRQLNGAHQGAAAGFARLYLVPGMNHCRGGPATDQFDMLSALVDWVERGRAPDRVLAQARGVGNVGGVNTELPANWSATRSRPLCPHPLVAQYKGGDAESAASFECR